jgi:hypothetical protein
MDDWFSVELAIPEPWESGVYKGGREATACIRSPVRSPPPNDTTSVW